MYMYGKKWLTEVNFMNKHIIEYKPLVSVRIWNTQEEDKEGEGREWEGKGKRERENEEKGKEEKNIINKSPKGLSKNGGWTVG